jgi:hypothetical protein
MAFVCRFYLFWIGIVPGFPFKVTCDRRRTIAGGDGGGEPGGADHAQEFPPKQRVCLGLSPMHSGLLRARGNAAKAAGRKWQEMLPRFANRGQFLQFAPGSIAGGYFIH